jgi:thioredoxin 1
MAQTEKYTSAEPRRADIDQEQGPTLIEFGTSWCGYCIGAQPIITAAFAGHPQVKHHKIEDGPGRRLGRSFGVKLWPTLIFLRDGKEVARLVRPNEEAAICRELEKIDPINEAG